ncbi:hypothetical protein G6011_09726 [Alternaria panax]|uniref:Uncharacterized protein n=1 Tax=Alternaria panax TaxID=48097 RepID=A0AAD4FD40_9PLEO|nr:hypothetical protein G6011_09726 [Alternaria panax]
MAGKSKASGISAVLHSYSNVSTRKLPAPAINHSASEENLHQRLSLHRAFKFTAAIVGDVQAANESCVAPVIILVGLDGWACDTRTLLLSWLQASKLKFEPTIRTMKPWYGMADEFAIKHGEVYWWTYHATEILQALERGPGHDKKTEELIVVWKLIQAGKDVSFGR